MDQIMQQFYPHTSNIQSSTGYSPHSSLPIPHNAHPHHRMSPNIPTNLSVPPSLLRPSPVPPTAACAANTSTPTRRGNKANGKEPNAPDKPLTPYMRYARKHWESVKCDNHEAKLADISRILGGMWRELDKKSKQSYIDEYEEAKKIYLTNLKAYRETPEYLEYQRMKQLEAERNKEAAKKAKASRAGEMKVDPRGSGLQVLEEPDDEPDESAINKQIAYHRFNKNHRLMSHIFNENFVLIHNNLPHATMENLGQAKKKSSELESHMKKLEVDIEELERENQCKKVRLERENEEFLERLREVDSGTLPGGKPEPIQINLKTLHSESKNHTYFEL